MIRRYAYILMVWVAVLLVGCDVHQWPEQHKDDVPTPTPTMKLALRLVFDTDFYVWEHDYSPVQGIVEESYPDMAVDEAHPGTTGVYSNVVPNGLMEIVVRVFPAGNNSKCVAEQTLRRDVSAGYDCLVELEVEQGGDYEIAVWAQLLEHEDDTPYYNALDFGRVLLENHVANTDYRDGFRGYIKTANGADVSSVDGTETYEVKMRRPMGKFEFITTDLSEFLDNETIRRSLSSRASIEDYRVVVSYPGYYSNSYSVLYDSNEFSDTGKSFMTYVTINGYNDASLGFDYVFVNDIPTGAVEAQVNVYDLSGNRIAGSSPITVPIRRNHHTKLRGAFFNMQGNGGVGIDPSYDDDHNMFIP